MHAPLIAPERLIVTGQAGSGKTRALAQIAAAARRDGITVWRPAGSAHRPEEALTVDAVVTVDDVDRLTGDARVLLVIDEADHWARQLDTDERTRWSAALRAGRSRGLAVHAASAERRSRALADLLPDAEHHTA